MTELVRYDAACKALAEAKRVDDVKDIRDTAIAMKAYAKVSKNHTMLADAAEIQQRATRRIGELIEEQKRTVGLNTGTQGRRVSEKPTLSDAGIGKNLANEARHLARLDADEFEEVVNDTRKAVGKAPGSVVRQRGKAQHRETRQQELGAKIQALPRQQFGVIYADPATQFKTHSERGLDRAADNHYPTQEMSEISALPVPDIAARDCILFLWTTVPMLQQSLQLVTHWGFDYKSMLTWDKVVPGTGYWFRNQTEHLIVATRGSPVAPGESQRMSSLFTARKGRHSAKPDGIADWIASTWPDVPRIELNARGPREGWDVWGNES